MQSKRQRSLARSGVVASILKSAQEVLRRQRLGETLVLAVSGGLDSMVLLDVVNRLRAGNDHGWRLIVAHFNHGLRGGSSDADERLVVKVASQFGIEVVRGAGDVRAWARKEKVSIEMAARKLRHDFLARTAVTHGARFVLTAHHADDQLELFFIRLLRGTGGTGIAGMQVCSRSSANESVHIVRPLLAVTRADLEEYAAAAGVRYRTDASNKSLKILRNRVRHELLPFLSRRFHTNVAGAVSRIMEIAGAEGGFVEDAAVKWLERRRPRFDRLHLAVQRRCIYHQIAGLGVSPDFALVERLRQNPGMVVSAGGKGLVLKIDGTVRCSEVVARRGSEVLVVKLAGGGGGQRGVRGEYGDAVESVPTEGVPTVEFGGVKLSWRIGVFKGVRPRKKGLVEFFDADAVGEFISLRHWRPGDRMRPIGMSQSVKLQDLFTNAKVPREKRSSLVVAEDALGRIFWVEGLRISEDHKLGEGTRREMRWERLNAEG